MKNTKWVLIIVSFLIFIPFHAHSNHAPKTSCHQTEKYLIVLKNHLAPSLGQDFLIKRNANDGNTKKCEYKINPGDFEIKNEWDEYFLDLKGDLLILDSGGGPYPRGLIIWDLQKQKKVYETSHGGLIKINMKEIVFWRPTGKSTLEKCPKMKQWESDGLDAEIESKVILSLKNLDLKTTNEQRCESRQ